MDIRVILMLAAVGAFALALLYKEGLLKKPAPIVIAVMLTALALVLRALVFGYETLDYQNFLTRWVDFFRQNGGWRALSAADDAGSTPLRRRRSPSCRPSALPDRRRP